MSVGEAHFSGDDCGEGSLVIAQDNTYWVDVSHARRRLFLEVGHNTGHSPPPINERVAKMVVAGIQLLPNG
jgi:hypothetical protein